MPIAHRLILGFLVCLLPGMSQALTLKPTSMDQLYQQADLAIVGEIQSVTVRAWPEKPGATWQDHRVKVLSVLKGAPHQDLPEHLHVGLPGGTRDGLTTLVFGVPTLHPGERYVFLLERVGQAWIPLNYAQGVWPEKFGTALVEGPDSSFPLQASRNGYLVMTTSSGAEVHWKDRCVNVWIQEAGSDVFDAQSISDVLAQSFGHWSDAQGGDLRGIERGYTCFDEVGFGSWPGPQNVIHFREASGSWIHPSKIAGLTTIMYREQNGEIVDADIEFNLVSERFTVDGSVDSFSLRYTMTHELGHLLGLDHSSVHASVMAVNSVPKNVGDFQLHSDDKNAVVANYPAGEGETSCETTSYFPPNGPHCPSPPEESGCSASDGMTLHGWVLLFMMTFWALRKSDWRRV